MRTPLLTRTRLTGVCLCAAAALLLSGCGSVHPGSAATVGDKSISMSELDRASNDMCKIFEPELKQAGQAIPFSLVRRTALQSLVKTELGKEFAKDFDVDGGTTYQQQVEQIRQASQQYPANLRDRFVELFSGEAYTTAVTVAAGRAALAEAGQEEPSDEDVQKRAEQLLTEWADEQGVDVDPKFGSFENGVLVASDTDSSFAVSDVAKKAIAEEPDQDYAKSLPAAQRCG